GAGSWTDDMFARAIREGTGHDGRALSWHMPYFIFKNLSDEDLASVIVYLRSIPPIHNIVKPTKMSKDDQTAIEHFLKPLLNPIPIPDFSNPVARGQYLVKIGECVGCHTMDAEYNPGLFGGGNPVHRFNRKAFSANITVDSSGISYGEQGFIFVLRTGKG